jgi:uncharacterized protein (DUF433 family)
MAAIDWSQCPGLERAGKRSGAWVFQRTRTPVAAVLDNIELGASIEDIMDWFHLTNEQVTTVIEYAARKTPPPKPPPVP